MEILHIENLSFSYPDCENSALSDLNFSVEQGEMILVCGPSGCGKTTLLKLLKPEISPVGKLSGSVTFLGNDLSKLSQKASAAKIGFVGQNPENLIVTDKVWHELAFGLESLGESGDAIRLKTAEMASFFGIGGWFRSDTASLSGGQKQLLALASVMAMSPEILILDEPTSQLDPIAAEEFLGVIRRINRQLGTTVIIAEHRLEEIFPYADKVLALTDGKITAFSAPEEACGKLLETPMEKALPSAARIFRLTGGQGKIPLDVREGRKYLSENFKSDLETDFSAEEKPVAETVVAAKNLWFRYEKNGGDVLRGFELSVGKGEFFCLLGGNGAGKTTAVKVISGLLKAYRGEVLIHGKSIKAYKGNSLYRGTLGVLPQNPQTVFTKTSVIADFEECCKALGLFTDEGKNRIERVLESLEIQHLANRHPLDLSGGEQQKAALGKVLLSEPQILILDEPTKAVDAFGKAELGRLLRGLSESGKTIICVTHDVEFAGEFADRCGLIFDGELVSEGCPRKFFSENHFYTTAASRISSGIFGGCVTCAQVAEKCLSGKEANSEK